VVDAPSPSPSAAAADMAARGRINKRWPGGAARDELAVRLWRVSLDSRLVLFPMRAIKPCL
jgi:hypothetical protein